MGACLSRLREHWPRVLSCSVSFALIVWAIFDHLTGVLITILGLSLALLSNRRRHCIVDDPKEPPSPSPEEGPIQSPPKVYCSICMESKPQWESFPIKFCSHYFCFTCVSLHVAAKVSENTATIRCPEPGCQDGILDLEMCSPILAQEVFDSWERLLCEKTIGAKFYCPFKDCSAVLADERADRSAVRQAECPHCHRLFCAWCEVPWHAGFSCEKYRKLGKDERAPGDLQVMKMAKEEKWQRCPKCKFIVEKTDGCMFMKCRCDFKFCYRCGTQTVRDHYCNKCKC